MNFKKIFQQLICLLLVALIFVNCSPIRANAAMGTTLVALTPFIAAALTGLGLSALNNDYTAFNQIVTNCKTWLETASIAGFELVDGFIALTSPTPGTTYIRKNILESIVDWLFSSKVLYPQSSTSKVLAYQGKTYTFTSTVPFLALRWDCQGIGFYMFVSTSSAKVSFGDLSFTLAEQRSVMESSIDYRNGYYTWGGCGESVTPENFAGFYDLGDLSSLPYFQNHADGWSYRYVSMNYVPSLMSSLATSSDNLVVSDVHPQAGTAIETSFPEWAAGEQTLTDDEGVADSYWPITVPEYVSSKPILIPQDEVWVGIIIEDETGEGSTDPTQPDTGEGTFVPMDPNYQSLIERLFGGVNDRIESVTISIQEIPELLREFAQDTKKNLEELPGKFKEWFDDIRTTLQQFLTGQLTILDILRDLFSPIRSAIVDALTYLFAPSETFISSQVEMLISKYPSSDNIFNLGARLGDFLLNLGQIPPVIMLDLGAAEGSFLFGGQVTFLDLTWYSRYKGSVDAILGGFLWLWFAWRVWLKLPGILSGASGTVGSVLSRRGEFDDN